MAHFDLPLDLPHAGTLAERISRYVSMSVDETTSDGQQILDKTEELAAFLFPFHASGENPAEGAAYAARDQAATIAREIVEMIEPLGIGFDRLGQAVRNLFECLELGDEGAKLSLRAGENPESLQRPV
jgi:hypothetical protein